MQLIDAGGSSKRVILWADAVRLRQVIINLLSNAVKYNRAGGSVRIICTEERPRHLRLTIADNGRGIPTDKQARLFTAFDRLGAERGTIEGSGIGLIITRQLVAAMQGSIGFVSVEDKGSAFWVEFPIHARRPLPAAPTFTTTTASEAAWQQAKVVLYIEDNPMNLRLMQHIFSKRSDLRLRDAHTAELGLSLAQADPPALILMDINLPGINGYAALAQLKADPVTATIPVVAVTSEALPDAIAQGLAAGFAAYLTKPINVPLLFQTLDDLLEAAP